MNCLRCDGLMIPVSMREPASCASEAGWRCLLCGETIDAVIAANRMHHPQPQRNRPRLPGSALARHEKANS